MNLQQISQLLTTIPDFPIKGIQFKDISPILQNAEAFSSAIDLLAECVKDLEFDELIGIDARGFIFGAALAYKLHKGFIMARKDSKLPGELLRQSFDYEYSQAALTLQKDRMEGHKKYLIVDDVLATGSTANAVADLIKTAGGTCAGILVFIELLALNGRQKLVEHGIAEETILSLIKEGSA